MRRGLYAGFVALLSAVVLVPSAAADDTGPVLSGRLQQLASPSLRDATPAEQGAAISLRAHGAGSLERDGDSLVVEVRVDGQDQARADALEAAGAKILHVSTYYDTITAAVDESELHAVAGVAGVQTVNEVLTPFIGRVGAGGEADPASGANNTCATGTVDEGATQLGTDTARAQFNVDGTGVKVGVLSDSYDTKTTATKHAADDIASGDLPGPANPCGRTTPVQVVAENPSPQGDEGRAMLQIVHDMAPGASLAFATAFVSETSFADNIRALAAAGANVIVDDVIFSGEPMYQDGPIAKAVDDVTSQGVTYFTMGFNSNQISGGRNTNSWEAPAFRPTACPAPVPAGDCMNFDTSGGADPTFQATFGSNLNLILDWGEPMFGVTDNITLYVLNSAGTAIVGSSTGTPTDRAVKFLSGIASGTYQIVIRRASGSGTPRLKLVNLTNGGTGITSTIPDATTSTDTFGPTMFGHNGAAAAQTVGAVPAGNSSTIETYSARGPVTYLFAPVSGTTPSAALPQPLTVAKPNVVATDCAHTTFFGGGNIFCGTSAAAPHAAGVGALQLSANPSLTRTQLMSDQRVTAIPVGSFGPEAMGAGLVQAPGAVTASTSPPPTVTVDSPPPTNDSTPALTFAGTGNATTFTCSIDGAQAQPCTSPFTPASPVSDGSHTLAVNVSDVFQHTASGSGTFTVDATAPGAPSFGKGPKNKTKSNKATFTFSGEAGSTFQCSLDNAAFSACTSPATVKVKKAKPKPKKHTFTVEATDALGNVGAPTTFNWTVVKKKKKHHHHH